MVRSIIWLIGFQMWCEALYCRGQEQEVGVDVLRKEEEHDNNDNCSNLSRTSAMLDRLTTFPSNRKATPSLLDCLRPDSRPESATAGVSHIHRSTCIQTQHGTAVNAEAVTSHMGKAINQRFRQRYPALYGT